MANEIAMAFPLQPGKRPALGQFVDTLLGERSAEYARSQVSVFKESWYLQQTAQGDLIVLYMDAVDPAAVFTGLAASQEPFDLWFKAQVQELTGIDLTVPPPALPSRVFHWIKSHEA